jgi:hypothetical protein
LSEVLNCVLRATDDLDLAPFPSQKFARVFDLPVKIREEWRPIMQEMVSKVIVQGLRRKPWSNIVPMCERVLGSLVPHNDGSKVDERFVEDKCRSDPAIINNGDEMGEEPSHKKSVFRHCGFFLLSFVMLEIPISPVIQSDGKLNDVSGHDD